MGHLVLGEVGRRGCGELRAVDAGEDAHESRAVTPPALHGRLEPRGEDLRLREQQAAGCMACGYKLHETWSLHMVTGEHLRLGEQQAADWEQQGAGCMAYGYRLHDIRLQAA